MPTPVETPADMTQKTVDVMESQFDMLDAVVDRSHPQFGEYMERRQKAQSIFKRMNMMFGIGQGHASMNFAAFQKDAEELQRLYEENVAIRAGMVYDSLKKEFRIDRATDMETSLQEEMEEAMAPFRSEELGSVRGRLAEICTEASQSPVDLLTEGTIGYYMIGNQGKIIPHYQKLERDIKLLHDAEETFRTMLSPIRAKEAERLLNFIRKLRAGLENIGNIDPQSKEMYRCSKQFETKHNWKPLRIFLAFTGGLFSVMGLGLAAAGKGFSPATGFWMAVAIGAARPDLFQGGDKAALESIKALDHKKIHYFLTDKNFHGKEGVQAFQDIQFAAESGNAELFHSLKDAPNVNRMQIDELLGTDKGTTSELLKSTKMSDADRADAIRLFGEDYDDGQKEMIETALTWGEYGIAKAGSAGTP